MLQKGELKHGDTHIPFHPPTCYHLLILQTQTDQIGSTVTRRHTN